MTTHESSASMPAIITRAAGGRYEIAISNPARRNALTLQMWRDLATCIHEAERDQDSKIVVIRGAGDQSFSSGADITEFAALRSTAAKVAEYSLTMDEARHAVAHCEKPTVALIQGVCMGGGMEIAAVCDIRYTNESGRFRMPAGLVGLAYPLDGVTRMVDIMGVSRVADIFMTSRTFGGQEAARIGFAQEVFADSQFEAQAESRINALLNSAPLSLRATKLAIRYLANGRDPASAREAHEAHDACFASHDYLEGQRAFKEKRKPIFKGV